MPDEKPEEKKNEPPAPDAKVKALEDLVADLQKKLEAATAKKPESNNIAAASESSVHALKDELTAVRAELKEALGKTPSRSPRWVPG